jgi:hypothetical protein
MNKIIFTILLFQLLQDIANMRYGIQVGKVYHATCVVRQLLYYLFNCDEVLIDGTIITLNTDKYLMKNCTGMLI